MRVFFTRPKRVSKADGDGSCGWTRVAWVHRGDLDTEVRGASDGHALVKDVDDTRLLSRHQTSARKTSKEEETPAESHGNNHGGGVREKD
jgi:hypothetical protein